MMRIAMVTDSFLPRSGGIELHIRDLASELAKAGNHVTVVSPFCGDATVAGITVAPVETPLWPRFRFAWTPAAVYRLEAILRAGAFDVVHHHLSIFSPLTVASVGLCLQLGMPVVVTGHSLWREYARALRWMNGVFSWSTKPLVLSGVSAAVAADFAPFSGSGAVEVLSNGIDVPFWKCATASGTTDDATGNASQPRVVRIVSVLRLARRKRPRVLLDIVERLGDALPPGVDFHMDIVGDGTERHYLEGMIASRRLGPRVTLHGHCTRERIRELFGRSDVFVLPTAEEAFGIAALEARTAGLPVVALGNGGVSEIIHHGVEGLLAHSDGELLSHVRTLLMNASLRERIAAHNRTTIPAQDWRSVVLHHERVYAVAVERMRSSVVIPSVEPAPA